MKSTNKLNRDKLQKQECVFPVQYWIPYAAFGMAWNLYRFLTVTSFSKTEYRYIKIQCHICDYMAQYFSSIDEHIPVLFSKMLQRTTLKKVRQKGSISRKPSVPSLLGTQSPNVSIQEAIPLSELSHVTQISSIRYSLPNVHIISIISHIRPNCINNLLGQWHHNVYPALW